MLTLLALIIVLDQFSRHDIAEIFDLADRLSVAASTPLAGRTLANLFYEPSTRTSSSFFAAMTRLDGGYVLAGTRSEAFEPPTFSGGAGALARAGEIRRGAGTGKRRD